MTTTNGVETATPPATTVEAMPAKVMRQLLTQERQGWQQHRARQLLGLELHMQIAKELGVDKSAEIKAFEAQLAECLVALKMLDAKLAELPDAS